MSNGTSGAAYVGTVAIEAPPIHDRGRLLLIVETGLASALGADLTDTFIRDLSGDGWTVETKYDAPRHLDVSPWNPQNGYNATNLKSWITGCVNSYPNTKAVILLGHVTVPYSGTNASEGPGHAQHECPWAADLYYADALGTSWTMNTNAGAVIGVGQFWNDTSPTAPELAVGRIDFARLPAFGTPDNTNWTQTEASLIRQYLAKNHRFRHKQYPFPLPDKSMFTTYVFYTPNNLYRNAKINSAAFFGDWPNRTYVGEPFRNNASFWTYPASPPKPCLWAFASGNSVPGCIYQGSGLDYSSTNIQQNAEPPIAFWNITGSYHADANMNNNLARSILAKPNYSLAVIPNSHLGYYPQYRLESMALGDTIGEAFLFSIESTPPANRHRWLNLQGDPTLRLHAINAPTITSASITTNGQSNVLVSLTWSSGESGSTYHVYVAATERGPFQLLTTSGAVSQTGWTNIATSNRVYMVRGMKLASTGSGSYWNLSQGSITNIP